MSNNPELPLKPWRIAAAASIEGQALATAIKTYVKAHDIKRDNNLYAQVDYLVKRTMSDTLLNKNCQLKQSCADRAGVAKSTFLQWGKL